MREVFKTVCVFMLVVGAIAATFVWLDERPTSTIWMLRVGIPLVMGAGVVWLIVDSMRSDRAPDYLRQRFGRYFDRDGLCFTCEILNRGNADYLDVHFQNRHSSPCDAKIALEPSFRLLGRPKIPPILVTFECPEGGFGMLSAPISMPNDVRGREIIFNVGAGVTYPRGKGETLRFGAAIPVRTNESFGNSFGSWAFVLGLLGSHVFFLLGNPTVTLKIPSGVAEQTSEGKKAFKIFWQLGDEPLPS
jgi:hypothetical protein